MGVVAHARPVRPRMRSSACVSFFYTCASGAWVHGPTARGSMRATRACVFCERACALAPAGAISRAIGPANRACNMRFLRNRMLRARFVGEIASKWGLQLVEAPIRCDFTHKSSHTGTHTCEQEPVTRPSECCPRMHTLLDRNQNEPERGPEGLKKGGQPFWVHSNSLWVLPKSENSGKRGLDQWPSDLTPPPILAFT